ncbi:9015_t:CDS:2, partial [Racocetra persica]
LYAKLSKLSWGLFAPKPFGVFLMITINFNTTSDYHWDKHDAANIVHLQPGQIIAFASCLLLHDNFSITKGIWHSVVYFVHDSFFHHLRDFTKVYNDAGIEKAANKPEQNLNNTQGLNNQTKLSKPMPKQTQIPSTISD